MNKIEQSLVEIILNKTGILLNNSNKPLILEYVSNRIEQLNTSIDGYKSLLDKDPKELEKLINTTTVNETYFFREEAQFDFLSNVYFPKKNTSPLRIWCGACSSGEEPLSVYALTQQSGIKAEIQASDIDTEILEKFKKGIYEKKSFRPDGEKYHKLINNISTVSGNHIEINRDVIKKIKIFQLNLNLDTPLPFEHNCFDLIILRNAMIYFSKEHINHLLNHLWNVLKSDGIILLSMSEIAAIENSTLFEKKKSGFVYYLEKKNTKSQDFIEKKRKTINPKENSVRNIKETEKTVTSFYGNSAQEKKLKKEINPVPVKEVYREVFSCFDTKNYVKAKQILDETTFNVNELEYKLFLEGMIAYQKGDYENSEKYFFKSSKLNSDFWPALMMLAFTYKNIDKPAKEIETFGKALNILDEYVKCGKVCYNFTIDFDPVYLLTLCKRNIEEAEQRSGE